MGLTTANARSELAEHFGPDAIEAMLDTAQELGQVTIKSTDGNLVTLMADDDAQCWYITTERALGGQTLDEHTAVAVERILGA